MAETLTAREKLAAAIDQMAEIKNILAQTADPPPVRCDRLLKCLRSDQAAYWASAAAALETVLKDVHADLDDSLDALWTASQAEAKL